MITIGEAIESVILEYNRGRKLRDTRLTTPLVYSTLISSRASLIKQQSNKTQLINHWAYQYLPCVGMEVVELDGCKILRSKYSLPKLISDARMDLLGTVTTDVGKIRFEAGQYQNVKYRGGSKYLADKPQAYLDNGYICVTKVKILTKVRVPGLFEDPIEVFNFPNECSPCTDCDCMDYNLIVFPVDRDLLETIIDMSTKKLVDLFLQTKEDDRVDSEDNTGLNRAMIHRGQ